MGNQARTLPGGELFSAVVRRQLQSGGGTALETPTHDPTMQASTRPVPTAFSRTSGEPTPTETAPSGLSDAKSSPEIDSITGAGDDVDSPAGDSSVTTIARPASSAVPNTRPLEPVEGNVSAFTANGAVEEPSGRTDEPFGTAQSITNAPSGSPACGEPQLFAPRSSWEGKELMSNVSATGPSSLVADADPESPLDAPKTIGNPAANSQELALNAVSVNLSRPLKASGRNSPSSASIPAGFRVPRQSNHLGTGKPPWSGSEQKKAYGTPNPDTTGTGVAEKQNADGVASHPPSNLKSMLAPAEARIQLSAAATGSTSRTKRIGSPRTRDMVAGAGENPDGTLTDHRGTSNPTSIENEAEPSFRPAFVGIRGNATAVHDTAIAKTIGSPSPNAISVAPPVRSSGSDLPVPATAFGLQPMHLASGSMTAQPSPPAHLSRAAASATFERMDSAAAPQVIESTPQRLAVGVHSSGLGWVEIRTSNAAGQVSATLASSSAQSHNAISGQLPTMREYLAGQHVQIATLASERFSSSSGDSSQNHSRSETAPPDKGMEGEKALSTTSFEVDTDSLSYINVRV